MVDTSQPPFHPELDPVPHSLFSIVRWYYFRDSKPWNDFPCENFYHRVCTLSFFLTLYDPLRRAPATLWPCLSIVPLTLLITRIFILMLLLYLYLIRLSKCITQRPLFSGDHPHGDDLLTRGTACARSAAQNYLCCDTPRVTLDTSTI